MRERLWYGHTKPIEQAMVASGGFAPHSLSLIWIFTPRVASCSCLLRRRALIAANLIRLSSLNVHTLMYVLIKHKPLWSPLPSTIISMTRVLFSDFQPRKFAPAGKKKSGSIRIFGRARWSDDAKIDLSFVTLLCYKG
jgi:hypothetical protein